LSSAIVAAQALARAEYSHFPNFFSALTQILSALLAMTIFSEPDSVQGHAPLTGQLAEGLSLLGTAQRELAAKADLLKDADAIHERCDQAAEKLDDLLDNAKESVAAATKHKASIRTRQQRLRRRPARVSMR
jgi:hypothetical protein